MRERPLILERGEKASRVAPRSREHTQLFAKQMSWCAPEMEEIEPVDTARVLAE
jgi:hypothetical protein